MFSSQIDQDDKDSRMLYSGVYNTAFYQTISIFIPNSTVRNAESKNNTYAASLDEKIACEIKPKTKA
jgi:hypothetical protein